MFSQSQVNIGIGAGQQFGYPGVRAAYKWNKIEGSTNIGLLGALRSYPPNYSKLDALNYCLGFGLSVFIKERSQFPTILELYFLKQVMALIFQQNYKICIHFVQTMNCK